MGHCDAEKSGATQEAIPCLQPPEQEQKATTVVRQIDCTKIIDEPCCDCDTCQHEAFNSGNAKMGPCEPEKSDHVHEAMMISHQPEEGEKTPSIVGQTKDKKDIYCPRCDCETCRHEAKQRTLVNLEPPTDANRVITTYHVSYGQGHPQYRSLMATLSGAPVEDNGLGPEPLFYPLTRAVCPSVDPTQATCSPYIPSVCPGPVYERHGPFPGLTEYQDTISSNAIRLWLKSQQIHDARPPTCICYPDPKTGSQPVCCQAEGKHTVTC